MNGGTGVASPACRHPLVQLPPMSSRVGPRLRGGCRPRIRANGACPELGWP
jgi:hypothetical protein